MSDIGFVVSVKLSAVLRMTPLTTLDRAGVIKELTALGIDNMIDTIDLTAVVTDTGSIVINLNDYLER
jgi:hypothetical protein